jgi:hypothetical protein
VRRASIPRLCTRLEELQRSKGVQPSVLDWLMTLVLLYRHLSQALTALARLHILNERPGSADEMGDGKELDLNQRFRENFRLALTGGCTWRYDRVSWLAS